MKTETDRCPVHKMLAKLKQFAGLPVPVMVKWHDGRPDFRVMDGEAIINCVTKRRCGICGEPLGETAWWIGGPLMFEHKLSVDPAMHKTCALESMRLCPFLNGKRQTSRLGGYHQEVYVHENVSVDRPERMLLMYGWAKHMRVSDRVTAIETGRLIVEREF